MKKNESMKKYEKVWKRMKKLPIAIQVFFITPKSSKNILSQGLILKNIHP